MRNKVEEGVVEMLEVKRKGVINLVEWGIKLFWFVSYRFLLMLSIMND